MHCPFCQTEETKVVDSRLTNDGAQVRRRRECCRCGKRFKTYETVELVLPRVVKRDGTRSCFDQEKLQAGMLRALEKRPVNTEAVDAAIRRIIDNVRASSDSEISSQRLGEWVMGELRRLDQVAYVRFASVYRSFQDVEAFRQEIERLQHDAEVGGAR